MTEFAAAADHFDLVPFHHDVLRTTFTVVSTPPRTVTVHVLYLSTGILSLFSFSFVSSQSHDIPKSDCIAPRSQATPPILKKYLFLLF
jgi:hypothetical protein